MRSLTRWQALLQLGAVSLVSSYVSTSAATETFDRDQPSSESSDMRDARLAAEVITGLGSPVGYAGAALTYFPVEWLGIGPGIGAGSGGTQTAFMLRTRFGVNPNVKLTLNLAYSRGGYAGFGSQCDGDCNSHLRIPRAHWLYFGWGFEGIDQGLWWRFEWGLGALLNPGDAQCVDRDTGAASSGCRVLGQNSEWIPLLLLAPIAEEVPCSDESCADPLLYLNVAVGHALF